MDILPFKCFMRWKIILESVFLMQAIDDQFNLVCVIAFFCISSFLI